MTSYRAVLALQRSRSATLTAPAQVSVGHAEPGREVFDRRKGEDATAANEKLAIRETFVLPSEEEETHSDASPARDLRWRLRSCLRASSCK